MFEKNKVSHLDLDDKKVTLFVSDENDFTAVEDAQRLINTGRDEMSVALVTDTFERLSYKYLLRPLGGIILALLVIVIGVVAMPQHDVIKEPEYWWECLVLQCNVIWINTSAAFFIANANILMNLERVYTFKHYLIIWFASVVFYSFSWVVTYAIWSPLLGFRYPIPFVGFLNAVLGLSSQVFGLWFLFPKAFKVETIKTRIRYLMLTCFFCINVTLVYLILWLAFSIIPIDYQWVIVLCLPVAREVLGMIISFLGRYSL